MSFFDKIKKVLLENNEKELANIEAKIDDIEREYLEESEKVQMLEEESKEAHRKKSDVQKKILTKKELGDLKTIYEFMANYSQIKAISERMVHANELSRYIMELNPVVDDPEQAFNAEIEYRKRLCGIVSVLNKEITQILSDEKVSDENNLEVQEEKNLPIVQPEVKKGFWARIFGRNKKENVSTNENATEKPVKKSKSAKMLFLDYRNTIRNFNDSVASFLVIDLNGPTVIDRQILTVNLYNIKAITAIQKRNIPLTLEDEEYLMTLQPLELWTEVSKYYSLISDVSNVVQNFGKNIDKFEKMYRENPEYFEQENLRRIFQENDEMVIDLRLKNKEASTKNSEYAKKKQDEKEKRAKLRELESKKTEIKARNKKISDAKSLKDLGFKNKEDAASKLGIETKDYIVIPISSSISSFDELFEEEKRLRVEVDGQTYFTTFINDVASGRINTISEDSKEDSALMIPIKSLKKEDIDSIRSGKVSVNKSVLRRDGVFLFKPEGRSFNIGDTNVQTKTFSFGKLVSQIESFLEDDFVIDSDETENYDIFKGIKNVSSKEKKLRKDAVIRCLKENVRRDIVSTDEIHVNGKSFYINKVDEKDIWQSDKMLPLDEEFLMQITDDISSYLIDDGNNKTKIDALYKKLLEEYMRVNTKVKAEYYEEDNSSVTINGKKLAIKPILPAKDETIVKRYSRPREDIVYKTMKLAALVNKFAHLTENQELQNMLYDAKLDLIENAIDLAEGNPNVIIKQKFDKNKMASSVVVEIPGYNMIALHIINKSNSLTKKANRLEEHTGEILPVATLQIPGINKELIAEMKKLPEEKRGQFLIDLDSTEFYKLVIRMGYTSDKITSEEEKKNFIKKMTSDQKLNELLKEADELER